MLRPQKTYEMNGVKVNEYLLTENNPNGIAMPRDTFREIIGITIHNTEWISVAEGTTPAEQYTRATVNGNMNDVRVHFYVDDKCAWQNLPLSRTGWHAADGSGDGNMKTIAIECIMNGSGGAQSEKSEDTCAKLAAGLLVKFGFDITHLFTHNHWYSAKYCPAYILPHWDSFVEKVKKYMSTVELSPADSEIYRIRLNWSNSSTQVGAYKNLSSAKKECPDGYSVFNAKGEVVFTKTKSTRVDGSEIFNGSGIKELTKGCKGAQVKSMQQLLIAKGYSCGSCSDDGDFGDGTEKALNHFKEDSNIEQNGTLDEETFIKLWGC